MSESGPENSRLIIAVDRTGLSCTVTILPGLPSSNPSEIEIRAMLEAHRVASGAIDHDAVAGLIERAAQQADEEHSACVARGTPPEHGEHAGFTLCPELAERFEEIERRREALLEQGEPNGHPSPAQDPDDGAIDFHELSPFVIVHAGDTIGSISEATDGSDGVDVRGETIPAKRGRTQSIKTDYTTRAEGDRLVAAVPGRLVHAIDRVVIETTLTIADDVDYHTGNIDFPGSVVVHGAVKDNFRVRATGDIKLEGLVEAAAIDTAADLSLTRGMAGRGAGEIRVGGDLLAGYLDGVEGTIGGNCVVTNEIKACRLRVARRVESPACAFYGGDLHAGLRIELGTLGSEGGVETAVSVGEHDEIDDLAARTKSLIAAIETKKDRAASELAALNGAIKKLNATQAERLTELQFEQIQADGLVAKLGEAAAELLGVLGRHASPTLVVKRRLHAGVRIRLRHACFVIRESITGPVT
jgi:uncharacterized protein (DUF342 family)